ncbi:TPA: hypothetical protein DCZ39_01250 [Patescibacteria group bacterium]|nr:hypothetical protein [Candidatus Gracilibacteria bacterium]
MNNNLITSIGNDTFNSVPNITVLSLNNNLLTSIDVGDFN